MKHLFLLLLLLVPLCAYAAAGDDEAFWIITNGAVGGQYPTEDAACQAVYSGYWIKWSAATKIPISDYQPPQDYVDKRAPNAKSVLCPVTVFYGAEQGGPLNGGTLARQELHCKQDGTFNPDIGKCQAPDEDQDQNEMGDPSNPAPGVVMTCRGDPVNTPSGNVYEETTDYVGGDGELAFRRYYNSTDGKWRHSYSARLLSDPITTVVTFDDGKGTAYPMVNGQPSIPEGHKERLSTQYSQWTYTSEDNTILTFDYQGRLSGEQTPDGLKRTLTYTPSGASGDTLVTVTGARGRVLTFIEDANHNVKSMTAGAYSVTYGYNTDGMLTSVAYSGPNLSKTRTYAYEDARNPHWLTSEFNESGVKFGSWTYDDQGRALAATQPDSAGLTSFSYTGPNTVEVTGPLGNKVTYQYEISHGAKRPVSIDGEPAVGCPAGNSTFHYNASGYPDTATRVNGSTTIIGYDSGFNETSRTEASGTSAQRTTQTTWDATLHLPTGRSLLDASGALVRKQSWLYNTRGQTVASCLADPSSASYACAASGTTPAGVRRVVDTYCEAVDSTTCPLVGLLKSEDGARTDVQDVTTYAYYMTPDDSGCASSGACHKKGDLYQTTDALGHKVTMLRYDADGRITRFSDTNGVIHDATYDALGRVLSQTVRASADGTPSAGDATRLFGYNDVGDLVSTTDADGVMMTFQYDDARRLVGVTDGAGNRIRYTLDAGGNRTKEEFLDASGAVRKSVSRSFNSLGQLLSVRDALNRTVLSFDTTDGYDAEGNPQHASDAKGVQKKNGYDALSRLVSTIDDYNGTNTGTANAQTVSVLDASDKVAGISDPSGLNTVYDHNGLGDLTGIHSPDTGTTTFTVDAAGNRLTKTDAKGTVTTYAYDALNRVITASYADATLNVAYHYDEANSITGCAASAPVGHLTRVVETAVTTTYCYDARGNVIEKRQTQGGVTDTLTYTYTLGDRVATETRPGGAVVSYAHDALGQVSGVSITPVGGASQAVASSITWLPFGPIQSYTLGNGQTVIRTYDANYRVTDIVSPALELHFSLDEMGNITGVSESNGGTASYLYDPLYRLTAVNDAAGKAVEAYSYNVTGDRLSKTAPGSYTGAYAYKSGTHWLTSMGTASRTYDASGNTTGSSTAGTVWGYSYNGRNRMNAVTRNGTTVGTYVYNAMNERVSKSYGSMTNRFVYDQASQLVFEASDAGRRDYIAVAGIPLAVADGSSLGFITADGLGSPRAVTSSTGDVVWSWPYATNPFGESRPVSSSGYVLNLRLPGQYADGEAGLKYNINRSFDAATGRYLQSDPIGLKGGVSTYSYASARPLSLSDPSGLVVKVCRDPAFNGAFGSAIKHNWITTNTQSIGMGTPAAGSNTGNQYDPLGARVQTVDHSGRPDNGDRECAEAIGADEDKVNKLIAPGRDLGFWVPGFHDCETFVRDVLRDSGGEYPFEPEPAPIPSPYLQDPYK
ncbi:RHS repeat-associated core domain-containing protein [Luteibacter sp. CQ10]|uniref:RHS repeat-associated core domain-containing protein n=1 Tax=Luteibacter sp. CQ10 TaxID=2805821 RepID=UPI0034A3844B